MLYDTVASKVDVVSDFRIKVVDTVENYTLQYTQTKTNFKPAIDEEHPVFKSANDITLFGLQKLEHKISSFEYAVLVKKQTGLAFELSNQDEYKIFVDSMALITVAEVQGVLNKLAARSGQSEVGLEKMQRILLPQFEAAQPQMLQAAMNTLNLLLRAYSYEFPLDKSSSEKIMVDPVRELEAEEGVQYPATITLKSSKSKKELSGSSNLYYDNFFIYEQMRLQGLYLENIKAADLSVVENADFVFDTKSSWIKTFESYSNVELPRLKTMNRTTVTFNK